MEQLVNDDAVGTDFMQYAVRHTTTYSYADPVSICQNQIHLTPRATPNQSCSNFQLEITPEPVIRRTWTDTFGNEVWYISIEEPHRQLSVTARSVVGITPHDHPAPQTTPAWEQVRDTLATAATPELRMASQFRFESPYIHFLTAASEYAAPSFAAGRPLLEAVLDLTARIHAASRTPPLRRPSQLRRAMSCSAGVESARTSLISRSPACAASVWRPVTSAATW